MSILKYKYKAHKLVNTLFYVVVFLIGFLLGFSTEKIDFNKLMSQMLMIDNVSAYTIYEDEEKIINEEYIYEKFLGLNPDFDINKTPYIYCSFNSSYISSIHRCMAYSEEVFNSLHYSHYHEGLKMHKFLINLNDYVPGVDYYSFYINELQDQYHIDYIDSLSFYLGTNPSSLTYTNFDVEIDGETRSDWNVLDFSKFGLNFKLNDGSIFEDENHLDFKKVCWENFDELVFSVTIDKSYDGSFQYNHEGQQDGETYIHSGFYVFDDISNLKRGTRKKTATIPDHEFYASTWLGGLTFNHLKDIKTEFDLLHTDENLGLRYSAIYDPLGNYDIYRQDSYYYDNLHKLKNASYIDFTYYYSVLDTYNYDVFYLKEKKDNFCIYIPNVFIVTTLGINELGGFVGDIPIHNNENDSFIDKTEVSGGLHFNQLFTIINNFIRSIKDTIIVINNFIYSLFLSLPSLVQMFIFTIITLIVIKTIIWMVVK